jgi:hypothetical protein
MGVKRGYLMFIITFLNIFLMPHDRNFIGYLSLPFPCGFSH